jgi:hypothetical protein
MAGIALAFAWMSILSVLLFWLPGLGPLIAGYVGGKKAGGVTNAIIAALIPAIAIAGLAFSGGVIADIPIIGAVLGGAAFLILTVHAFPLLVGGIVGGALATESSSQSRSQDRTITSKTSGKAAAESTPSRGKNPKNANGTANHQQGRRRGHPQPQKFEMKVLDCHNCGSSFETDGRYCKYCGVPLR